MGLLSSVRAIPQERSSVRSSLAACLTILITSLASPGMAQSTPEDASPGAWKETAEIKGGHNSKYDIDHIGHRGVGHGFNIYSVKREEELGRSLAAGFDHNTKIVHDVVVNEYVNRLVQKIVRNSDAEVPFIVKIIDSGDIPRAYGLPGGFIYVDSALMLAADGEAELASMIAREVAHVAARHATRALTRRRVCSIMNSMALLTGPAGVALENVGGVAGPLSMQKFSRDAEYEADLLGLEYTYAAGYDPDSLLAALEKLRAMEVSRNSALSKIP